MLHMRVGLANQRGAQSTAGRCAQTASSHHLGATGIVAITGVASEDVAGCGQYGFALVIATQVDSISLGASAHFVSSRCGRADAAAAPSGKLAIPNLKLIVAIAPGIARRKQCFGAAKVITQLGVGCSNVLVIVQAPATIFVATRSVPARQRVQTRIAFIGNIRLVKVGEIPRKPTIVITARGREGFGNLSEVIVTFQAICLFLSLGQGGEKHTG